jgi:hypothetical protein
MLVLLEPRLIEGDRTAEVPVVAEQHGQGALFLKKPALDRDVADQAGATQKLETSFAQQDDADSSEHLAVGGRFGNDEAHPGARPAFLLRAPDCHREQKKRSTHKGNGLRAHGRSSVFISGFTGYTSSSAQARKKSTISARFSGPPAARKTPFSTL